MGVKGLLVLLKSIQRPCNVKKFKGLTLGVDAYGWLHPGTIPCAVDLALDKPNTKYVDYAMHRVRMLLHYGITPYIIFDGNYLPSKAGTETKRAASREEAKRNGLELLKMGKTAAAQLELCKAVDITPAMARNMIEELKRLKVKYVVAPYEADAQLAYMEREGLIDGIISEDSDMLVFGAKRLITKMDKYGECIEINRAEFTSCKAVSFAGWTDDMFRRMAILTGCDYLDGIPKLGLKTAHNLVRRYKDVERILKVLQFEGKIRVPPGYLEAYTQAELTFLHQWVYDPRQRKLVMGLEWPDHNRPVDISFIGADLEKHIATGVAVGHLDPITKQPMKVTRILQTPGPRAGSYLSRRSIVDASSDDPKSHKKPIESFFKPRRTPLAELDPNILTPSPSQQELLRRHSGTIVSNPVDENNTPVASLAALPAIRSTGGLRTQHVIATTSRRSFSSQHPPKRQRLCEDSPGKEKSSSVKISEASASRFFSKRAPDPSPTLKRQVKKRVPAPAVNVFADAPVEESMLSLSGPGEPSVTSPGKLKVFQDHQSLKLQPAVAALYKGDYQSTSQTESVFSVSTSMESDATADTSFSSTPGTSSLREKLKGASYRELDNQRHGSGPTTLTQKSTATIMPGRSINAKPLLGQTPPSALQRLGRQALSRSRTMQPQKQAASELPNLPASQPCARAALVLSTGGSEDLFVPNSEDDGEEERGADDQDEIEEPRAFNLGQFAFTG